MRVITPSRLLVKEAASLKTRDFAMEVKAVEDDGKFTGYGSVFGVVDSYREIVAKGAFEESLREIRQKGRKVPILWQHSSRQPLGVYDALSEDEYGLKVEGTLLKDDVSQAREAHALMKAGAVTGLSIGYYVRQDSWDEKERIRTLTKLDLVEISVVTFPANPEARVDAVKAKLAAGELPTLPEFENLLRESGFSKSQATAIASRGLAHLLRRSKSGSTQEAIKPEDVKELADAIRSFQLPKFGKK